MLFAPSGAIGTFEFRFVIAAFELYLFTAGAIFLLRRKTLRRGQLITLPLWLILIAALIEAGLHISHPLINPSAKEEAGVYKKEYLLIAPYKDAPWASGYWREYNEALDFEFAPFVKWRKRPYGGRYINIEPDGTRRTWNSETAFEAGAPEVFFFGGSTVWGMGARDAYTIPSYFSKILHTKGLPFIVRNYGETAYTFQQEIVLLITLLGEGKRPDYAIFYGGVNNVYAAYQSGKAGALHNIKDLRERLTSWDLSPGMHFLMGLKKTVEEHSMIYKAINRVFRKKEKGFKEAASGYTDKKLKKLAEEIAEDYGKSLRLLDGLSKIYGFQYVCLWQPVVFTEKTMRPEMEKIVVADERLNDKALGKLYNFTKGSIKQIRSSRFFDISDAFDEEAGFHYIDFCHLSGDGNRVVAEKTAGIFEKEFVKKR